MPEAPPRTRGEEARPDECRTDVRCDTRRAPELESGEGIRIRGAGTRGPARAGPRSALDGERGAAPRQERGGPQSEVQYATAGTIPAGKPAGKPAGTPAGRPLRRGRCRRPRPG